MMSSLCCVSSCLDDGGEHAALAISTEVARLGHEAWKKSTL